MCWKCLYGDTCTCSKTDCKNKKCEKQKCLNKKALKPLKNKALQFLENK